MANILSLWNNNVIILFYREDQNDTFKLKIKCKR